MKTSKKINFIKIVFGSISINRDMVLECILGQLVWTDLLPLKRISFSSTPPSFDSTVITLSRDIVHKIEKTHPCRKKVDSLYFSRKQTSFDKLTTSAFCYFHFHVFLQLIRLAETQCDIFPLSAN